ncbi:hypothetical protein HRbin27_01262 [bacterium HR27]|nr:hypothetical protein HRbin27_01262 [bacterium HR27]
MADRLPAGGAECQSGLPNGRRDSAQRFACGDDDDREDEQAQRQCSRDEAPAEHEGAHEHAEAEKPVHDRRHGCQIRDVDLDDRGQPVLRCELFEIEGSGDPEWKRDERDQHEDVQRSDQCGSDTSLFRSPRGETGQEVPGKNLPAVANHIGDEHAQRRQSDHDRRGTEDAEEHSQSLAESESWFELAVDRAFGCHS